jgi:uncharacterized protein with FMN-binding domain
MRKIFLSAIVIISFIGYVWYVHTKGIEQAQIITPNKIGKSKIIVTPTDTPVLPTPTATAQTTQTSAIEPTTTPQPTVVPTSIPQPQGQYKDGTYTGSVADAFYGPLQVQVTVSGGKISNVQFLQAPSDHSESIQINQQADPMLAQEAIQAQSAQVDVVSGATQTSQAFVQSMQSALSQAKS